MDDVTFAKAFALELEAEVPASRKCLERIPEKLFNWKPHPKSMEMGYLSLLVAEIPLWITHTIKHPDIDFATFQHFKPQTTQELVSHFDKNITDAKSTLLQVKGGELNEIFELKGNGKVMHSTTKRKRLESTINHLVHHRGQLTVYMRLNEIAVPSIYGPSADEKGF